MSEWDTAEEYDFHWPEDTHNDAARMARLALRTRTERDELRAAVAAPTDDDRLTPDERLELLRVIDTSRRAGLLQSDSIRDQVASAVERIVAERVREAERRAEERWMRVTVMKDGEAIREARADAFDEGYRAAAYDERTSDYEVRTPNPYRADRLDRDGGA